MIGIDIDLTVTVLRLVATVLTAVALFVWARLGPAPLAAGLFTVLAGLAVKANDGWAHSLEASAQAWIRAHRTPGAKADASAIFGALGEPVYVAAFAAGCGVLLAAHARSAIRSVVLAGAVGVGVVIEQALKAAVGHGFPSGHVMGTATLFGLIAVLLATGRRASVGAMLAVPALAAVGFMAVLAVYCGAHTVAAVIGGAVLGSALVALGTAVVVVVESRPVPVRRQFAVAEPADLRPRAAVA